MCRPSAARRQLTREVVHLADARPCHNVAVAMFNPNPKLFLSPPTLVQVPRKGTITLLIYTQKVF